MSSWLSPKNQNPIVTKMLNKNKGKKFPSLSESRLKELKRMDQERLNNNANWLSPKKQNDIVTDMINKNKGKRFPSPKNKSKSKRGGSKNTKSRKFRKTRHRSRV